VRSILVVAAVVISTMLALASAGGAAEFKAGTASLRLDERLQVTGMAANGQPLKVAAAPLVSLAEVETGRFVPAIVTGGSLDSGLSLNFPGTRTTGVLRIISKDGALRFAIDLQGEDVPARGMLLRFSFPVDATGWQWYSDMQSSGTITADTLYENVVPLRAYADLPEWKDKPALRMGYGNKNFCTVLTNGRRGTSPRPTEDGTSLVLAAPLDKPCIFRTAYDGPGKRLDLIYDFALTAQSRKPDAVSFAFDLYDCDPAWGMRSALAKYYAMYPEMFKVWVRQQGQWMAFNRLSEIDNANEFWFALQEGAPEVSYDDKIDVLDCIYYTHAGMWGNLPKPYDPEKDPLPPLADQIAAVNRSFKDITKLDNLYDIVGTRKPNGDLAVEKWSVYAHLLAQFDLDPELPWGDYLIKNTITRTEQIKKQTGGELDGFYYDGLTSGLDYAPDHFKTHDAPILWDPVNKKPFINNFYSSVEFARGTAELLRPKGQITMMNGALGDSFYVIPWLDILGAETGLRIPRQDFNYIRTVIYKKPFLTLLKGNYEKQIARPEMELFMKRCLAYGVYPGFFDWPPSGLGPGGQYWNHPRYYERDRDLFRKYEPLCRNLAMAGWEPITYAQSSDANVYVERYGPDKQGIVWLSVLNEESKPHPTTLTIDAKALGLDPKTVKAQDMVSGQSLTLKQAPGGVTCDLTVAPDAVLAVKLASPEASAQWHVAQSLEALDRGVVQRKVDVEKPAIAVHWRPGGPTYSREDIAGKAAVVLKPGSSLRQWVMLFQPSAQPLKLKLRVKGDAVAEKAAKVRCRIAWVTPNYTYYDNVDFALPSGTYDWQEVEFALNSEHALRCVEVTPQLSGSAGSLRIATVSVTNAEGQEQAIDPAFTQWYEPQPQDLRPQIEQEMGKLREALAGMPAGQLQGKAAREALSRAFGADSKIRSLIVANKAENGCRRVLRDLDTIDAHLGQVVMASYNIAAPAVTGPTAAAPGDMIALAFAAPKITGIPTRTEILSADLPVQATATGGILRIPASAKPGDSFELAGVLYLGNKGAEAAIRTAHRVTVVPPLELTLSSQGLDPETGQARLGLVIRNNHLQPITVNFQVIAPNGWQVAAPPPLKVPASGEAAAEAKVAPVGPAAAGSLELAVVATSGKDTAQARQVMLYIPREANLLKNGGFEDGDKGWSNFKAPSGIDTTVARSGKASMRLENPSRMDSQAAQSVSLNQKQPTPILVQASSKAEDVEGPPGTGYSLYVDIYYTDGTKLYGTTYNFKTGTTGWQLGELYIEPSKPIASLSVNLLLRGKSGKAWFDDLALMEDASRKGNLARPAQVSVDSSFSGYDATPINDGIIHGEGLHWTKEAWASADSNKAHWIELKLPAPISVGRASVYWSLDAGVPRTSQEVQLQVPQGEGWRTVATLKSSRPVPQSDLKLDQPISSDRFRLLQPEGKGSPMRAGLMWVREVELFAQ
jgi:hypothetical protein